MSLKRVYFFRHGETDWNREERFQGHLDIPLNDVGRTQARNLRTPLARLGIQAVLSSDLSRALTTAQIAAGPLGVPLRIDPRLREAYLGEAQGMTRREMEGKFGPNLVQQWRNLHVSDQDIAFPGGESTRQVADRVITCVEEALKGHPEEHWGISTHGGVIRRVLNRWLPPSEPHAPIPNGVVYGAEFNLKTGVWTLLSWLPG